MATQARRSAVRAQLRVQLRDQVRRRPIQLLLAGALLFIIASTVPPVIISQMRPLSDGLNLTFNTREAETLGVVATLTGSEGIPEENRDRPECRDGEFPDIPYSCFVVSTLTRQVTAVTTSAAPKSGEVEIHSVGQTLIGDRVLSELQDGLRADRRSTYPVSDPVSRLTVSIPGMSGGLSTEPFVREGFQYFFPMPTSQKSYPWFDGAAMEPLLLDYVQEVEHNGLDTYEFHHTLTAIRSDQGAARILDLPAEEQAALGSVTEAGLGTPWYAVDRTMWVEPRTGTIVDIHARMHLYFAHDEDTAEARAFSPDPEHTIFHTHHEWDEDTLTRQREHAAGEVATLRALQIVAVLLKSAAVVLALAGVGLLLRDRRRR